MGRKSKLTEELIQKAYKFIQAGNHQVHVAQLLGIDKSTWFRWLQKGERQQSGMYRAFFDAVKKAEAEAIARNVTLIQKAAQDGSWQAAAWWLERKYPEEWGRKDRLNLGADNEIRIEIVKVDGEKQSSS